jgi:hypothetical protein
MPVPASAPRVIHDGKHAPTLACNGASDHETTYHETTYHETTLLQVT